MHPEVDVCEDVRTPVDVPQGELHGRHHSLPDPGHLLAPRRGRREEAGQVDVVAVVPVPPRVLLVPETAPLLPGGQGVAEEEEVEEATDHHCLSQPASRRTAGPMGSPPRDPCSHGITGQGPLLP